MVEIFGGLLIVMIIVWMILVIALAVLEYSLGMKVLSIIRSLFETDKPKP